MEYHVSPRCYVKMMMHSLKYPSYTVNGLLLGERKKGKDSYVLVDCIPLFHLGHGLTSCMETALHIISNHCKENNLTILAYYQANKDYYDSSPNFFASKIAEKLWEANNDTVLVMLNSFGVNFSKDSEKINEINETLNLYGYNDGRWKQKSNIFIEKPNKSLDLVKSLVFKRKNHLKLIDFDNHLDDISCDWRNLSINSMINDE